MTNNELANDNFNWDIIKNRVPKGQRHATLVAYYRWLHWGAPKISYGKNPNCGYGQK